jgi:hypothetical protein
MVIEKLFKKESTYAPVSIKGTDVIIGPEGNSVSIDVSSNQDIERNVIGVYTEGPGSNLHIDNGSKGYSVATIIIPPKKFEIIDSGTEESDLMNGERTRNIKVEALPVDMNSVVVSLWPLPFEVEPLENKEQEEI